MLTYCILVTDTRNGGQHEILVRALQREDALSWLAQNRPAYIAKRVNAISKV